ncbi:DUF1145 domain-containing protein [Metapseudomonas furukawaii]|uniref:Adenine specific DNA methylase Mod n=1 Tax=Metapseudomonas furukawaii TaxID=1149133 RepID=A0AAD1BXC8_METFU|nr:MULTISPECIES: DUF1145 domain-containing protein [Pseudomonas]ELS26805.1 hypothetical protein ppKF707_2392 [Pseudomonas furukawaii]OWJ90084.1 hypothetical protein B6S59_28855 [Pseudomonas sp. A46]WAG80563.1 DUF1145 domain-containing protein [Pseudomonas furukawaii]BAU73381.1 adenine specific DNA methylase Mod [Pseudomonas furukawaii]
MRFITGVGKFVALLFWLAVVANLVSPFAKPFDLLLNGAGVLVALVHLLEIVLFNALLQRRPHPWRDRVMLLLFGIFHLLGIPRRAAKEAGHA